MRRRVTLGLGALRAAALGALLLLVWNPTVARVGAEGARPLVLLDASLSMTGHGGRWRDALDTARALARGGVIWRFGARVGGFDTVPPADGASRLAPALDAAAARGGPVTVVSDGAVTDLADIPPDLARGARIVVLPRSPFFDAFVASVEGPRRVGAGDTVRLRVSYGTAGKTAGGGARERPGKGEERKATLAVNVSGRRVLSRPIVLPDSGIVRLHGRRHGDIDEKHSFVGFKRCRSAARNRMFAHVRHHFCKKRRAGIALVAGAAFKRWQCNIIEPTDKQPGRASFTGSLVELTPFQPSRQKF